MDCIDRRGKERRKNERRQPKRYFTLQKTLLLLLVSLILGAAHYIGWQATQDVRDLKVKLRQVAELQQLLFPKDVEAYLEHIRLCPHDHHRKGEPCPLGHNHILDSREEMALEHPEIESTLHP